MMVRQLAACAELAPEHWKIPVPEEDSRLHQLAPYIGKLKPVIARHLLQEFTKEGDVVLDCFSGSGTIPLEAALLGRKVLAFDANPYAVTLTRAKLEAPSSLEAAMQRLDKTMRASQLRCHYSETAIPDWVKKFFHPNTLQNALKFADECIEKDEQFLMACLLSILHHQRPGFLSYPSSHLVPYLRDRKFPRDSFPEMYDEREIRPRIEAKIRRTYKNMRNNSKLAILAVGQTEVSNLNIKNEIDAVVTSPPYMNALDYVRDNRLRMWFLDRKTVDYSPEPTEKPRQSDEITADFARNALSSLRTGGLCILVVGETVLRKRVTTHPADRIFERLLQDHPSMKIEHVIQDEIPDIRRSRRSASATKRELILVLRK